MPLFITSVLGKDSSHGLQHTLMALWPCSLIRASRGVNKAVQPYRMDPPWGQPEPVRHTNARPSAGVGLTRPAYEAGSQSSVTADTMYSSLDGTKPDLDQVRPEHPTVLEARLAREHTQCAAVILETCQGNLERSLVSLLC